MTAELAKLLRMPEEHVLVGSTGRIGVTMPMVNVRAGIREAVPLLGHDAPPAAEAAEAIMTSDTRPKQIAVEFKLGGKTARIGGICKGAGMIQPGTSATGQRPAAMPLHATMLCFITTDAAIEANALRFALHEAVAHSFNRITVDGAKTSSDADAAARAVANSSLAKASWHGGDPNWGRIMDAISNSAATVIEEKVDIGYSASGSRKVLWSLRRGQPMQATFKELCLAVAPREFDLHIHLNLGKANAVTYAADLTEDYLDFNKGDVSDPTTLGG